MPCGQAGQSLEGSIGEFRMPSPPLLSPYYRSTYILHPIPTRTPFPTLIPSPSLILSYPPPVYNSLTSFHHPTSPHPHSIHIPYPTSHPSLPPHPSPTSPPPLPHPSPTPPLPILPHPIPHVPGSSCTAQSVYPAQLAAGLSVSVPLPPSPSCYEAHYLSSVRVGSHALMSRIPCA